MSKQSLKAEEIINHLQCLILKCTDNETRYGLIQQYKMFIDASILQKQRKLLGTKESSA